MNNKKLLASGVMSVALLFGGSNKAIAEYAYPEEKTAHLYMKDKIYPRGTKHPLSEITSSELRQMRVHNRSCDQILNRLREIRFSYLGFDDKVHNDGRIIVLDALADRTIEIFRQLLEIGFPIYGADPAKGAMLKKGFFSSKIVTDKNYDYTSGYGCRDIKFEPGKVSLHSLGAAIDLNPLQNPYVKFSADKKRFEVYPEGGIEHMNRQSRRLGKEDRNGIIDEKVVKIFARNGFNIWDGYRDNPINYMHFQISRELVTLLVAMDPEDAKALFEAHVRFYNTISLQGKNNSNKDIIQYMMREIYPETFQSKNIEDLARAYQDNKAWFHEKLNHVLTKLARNQIDVS